MFGRFTNVLMGAKARQEQKQQHTATTSEQKQALEARKVFEEGVASVRDLIAPSALEIDFDYMRLSEKYVRTFFVYAYPRFIFTNWLSPIVNMDAAIDISMFVYPVESRAVLENLRKRVAQMDSTMSIEAEKGKVRDPALQAAVGDAEELRDKLQMGELRFFQFALYFTIFADSKEELETVTKRLETILGSTLIYTKPAHLQQEQGFNSTLPISKDELYITRNMDTGSLSTAFPFTSTELSSNTGILYGMNRHNNTLIIFDRFSLENANSVIFAKSGAGKSYAVKLEALRYLMLGTDIIIIDPEKEYENLARAVDGAYLNLSLNSDYRINPFDLPVTTEAEEGEDVLRSNVVALEGLIKLMLGGLSPEEEAILEKSIYETYAAHDITADPQTHASPAPTMTDLAQILGDMGGADRILTKLKKFTEGTFAGLFNRPTNIDLNNKFVVFSIRDLEDQLRPIAMHMVINYVWNMVRANMKKRLLIVDEAWNLMQHEDSAKFIYSIAKRARKYYLGLTTVSQDVEDMLGSKWGNAIVNNSSLQLLLKQSPAAVDKIAAVFKLTEGEQMQLLNANVGDGLFFAGPDHVAIHIYASYTEDQLITTNPKELLEIAQAEDALGNATTPQEAKKAAKKLVSNMPPSPEVTESGQQISPAYEEANVAPANVADDQVMVPVKKTTENLGLHPLVADEKEITDHPDFRNTDTTDLNVPDEKQSVQSDDKSVGSAVDESVLKEGQSVEIIEDNNPQNKE